MIAETILFASHVVILGSPVILVYQYALRLYPISPLSGSKTKRLEAYS